MARYRPQRNEFVATNFTNHLNETIKVGDPVYFVAVSTFNKVNVNQGTYEGQFISSDGYISSVRVKLDKARRIGWCDPYKYKSYTNLPCARIYPRRA